MLIEQLRKERESLEEALTHKIADCVETFRKETGFSPDYISVPLIEATQIGDQEKRYIVGRVKVNVTV